MEKTVEKSHSEQYSQFLTGIDQKGNVEDKLRCCLDFMRQILQEDANIAFRDFWDAKRLCLELFKEKILPRSRNVFWAEYVELSEEIRRIKEVLDDQSSFAHEQIELAVEALEKDFVEAEKLVQEMNEIEIPAASKILQKKKDTYNRVQKELHLLNTFAGRLNALRKELVNTQMRIRYKNRLFERLSKVGDLIFPKRKNQVRELSELFIAEVDSFILEQSNLAQGPYFTIKDEIKHLQTFAKTLSLDNATFSKSREKLSCFWDQIKEKEKEHFDKRSEQKIIFKENVEKILPKIDALCLECAESKLSLKEADQRALEISKEMKELELGRDEVRGLKNRLSEALKPLEEKDREEADKRRVQEALQEKKKLEALDLLLNHSLELLDLAEALSIDVLVEKWEALVKEEKRLSVTGINKALLENRIHTIADHIQEKKWQIALEENSEDLTSILHGLLDERHKARRKLKESLEQHRKTVGGSGLDLEHAMIYQQLMSDQKIRLDSIETMIEEIEERLFDLEE